MILFQSSIASSVPLLALVFMILKPSTASSTPLTVLIVCVLVSVRLYVSTTSTPTTTINTESYDGGSEDVDCEDDMRKFEDGEVWCSLGGGWGDRT